MMHAHSLDIRRVTETTTEPFSDNDNDDYKTKQSNGRLYSYMDANVL